MKKASLVFAVAFALLSQAGPVLAATRANASTTQATAASTQEKIDCVGTAVAARESALGGSFGTYTTSISAAYSARERSLGEAYSKTSIKEVRAAVKQTWADFSTATKNARKTWAKAKNDAWVKFKADAKVCKATSTLVDSEHTGSEL